MAIEITGTFGPTGTNQNPPAPAGFPTHEANFGLGGYMQVADDAARDAISDLRRAEGMAVYVNDTDKLYVLKDGVTNNDWVEFSSGSGPGGSIDITGEKPDGSAADIQGATELAMNTSNFTVNPGNPSTKAEVTSAYNTNIDLTTSVAINVNDLNNLTAADFVGLSTTDVLNKLLFPTLDPVYTQPTASLADNAPSTVEIGSTVNNTLTLELIKNDSGGYDNVTPTITSSLSGSLTVGGVTTTPVQNLQDQFGYPNANNDNFKYTCTATDSFTMPVGNVNYTSSIGYSAGNELKDSTGNDSGPAIAAGSKTPINGGVNGIYPWFHFRSSSPITTASMQAAIAAGNATKELSSSTGTIDVPFLIAAPGEYLAVAYPATSTTKTKFFINVSNQGLISVIFNDPPVTAPVDSPDNFWTGVNYKIIVSNSVQQSTDSPLELRNN
tara:strand:- start:13 stop:1332 length:1320 start_codon:yes stop_codon:yes gene_type:complete